MTKLEAIGNIIWEERTSRLRKPADYRRMCRSLAVLLESQEDRDVVLQDLGFHGDDNCPYPIYIKDKK